MAAGAPDRSAWRGVMALLEAEVRDSHAGANGEGDGVIPDIAAPTDKALEA